MNDSNKNMQENAKVDWMKIVNRHKKKQKGLPALSKLNTNAGNVEHNIKMFNMMQPDGSASVDASSGNISSGDCCESYITEDAASKVVLKYDRLPVEVPTKGGTYGGYYSSDFGNYLPDTGNSTDLLVEWEYKIDKQDVVEYLQEKPEVLSYLNLDYDVDEDMIAQKIKDNFDKLVVEFNEDLKDEFYEDAVKDAQENYKYEEDDSYLDYDLYEESLSTTYDKTELDDKFDMSMRTLL